MVILQKKFHRLAETVVEEQILATEHLPSNDISSIIKGPYLNYITENPPSLSVFSE